MVELIDRHVRHTEKLKSVESVKIHESYLASTKLSSEHRQTLLSNLDDLISLYQRVSNRPEQFAKRAAAEITGDHDREMARAVRDHNRRSDNSWKRLPKNCTKAHIRNRIKGFVHRKSRRFEIFEIICGEGANLVLDLSGRNQLGKPFTW